MSKGCPYCDKYKIAGNKFCGKCGRDLSDHIVEKPHTTHESDPLRTLCIITCLIVSLILVIELAIMYVNMGNVFSYLETNEVKFFVIIPSVYVFASTTGLAGQLYWILLIVIITVCALYALKELIYALIESKDSKNRAQIERTGLFWVSLSLCSVLVINAAVTIILMTLGLDIESPIDLDDKNGLLYSLANAAVWEEIVSRVLYLGLPLAIIALIIDKDKRCWKYLLGGFEMNKIAVIFILFSAIMFGFGHYNGWGWEKVPLAALMGIALGYVFVRFGLYACIILHFINDYLISLMWTEMGQIGTSLIVLLIMALGIPTLLYIVTKIANNKEKLKELPLWNH